MPPDTYAEHHPPPTEPSKGLKHVALSIRVFGIYLLLLGAILVLAPNILLELFGLPTTEEVWIRVAGMMVMGLGYHYTSAALYPLDLIQFYRWTVWLRPTVFLFFLGFILLDMVGWPLIYFGIGDVIAAAWTGWAMRSVRVADYTAYTEGNKTFIARRPRASHSTG